MLTQFHLRSNFQKYVSTKIYLYLIVYFVCGGKVDASERLKYENPFKDNDIQWKQKLNAFIHNYEEYCTNEDTTINILETKQHNKTLKSDEIPYFSPCGLSDRDIFNIYKFLEFEDTAGKPKKSATLTGCGWFPDDVRVSCADTIKGKCVMQLGKDGVIALPGTKVLSYKDQNSNNTSWITCVGKKWDSPNKNESADNARGHRLAYDSVDWVPSPITDGADCGRRKPPEPRGTQQVQKGKPAELGEFPWQAAIYNNSRDLPICGATIISQRFLLSAAHCFTHDKQTYGNYTIIVGILESNRSIHEHKKSQIHMIQELFTRGYTRPKNPYRENDIVIIMTKTVINFVENHVSPLCLIDSYYPKIAEHSNLIVSGWGITETDKQSDQLMYIDVLYQSYDECSKQYEHIIGQSITSDKICAGKSTDGKQYEDIIAQSLTPDKMCARKSKDVITLDSADMGGGFAAEGKDNRYYLIGVVTLTFTEQCYPHPVMGTFLPHFLRWILEIYQQNMHINIL